MGFACLCQAVFVGLQALEDPSLATLYVGTEFPYILPAYLHSLAHAGTGAIKLCPAGGVERISVFLQTLEDLSLPMLDSGTELLNVGSACILYPLGTGRVLCKKP